MASRLIYVLYYTGTGEEEKIAIMRSVQKYAASFIERVRGAIAYIRQHSLLMPTLISFFCLIAFVLMSISIWFSQNVRTTLEETIYQNAEHHASLTADQFRLSFEDCLTIAAHLKRVETLSPRSFQSSSYNAYEAIKAYNITRFNYNDLVLCYTDTPLLLSIYGTSYPDVCFAEAEDPFALVEAIRAARSITLLSTGEFGASRGRSRLLLIHPLSNRHSAVFVLSNQLLTSFASATVNMRNNSKQVLYSSAGDVLWSTEALTQETQDELLAHTRQEDSSKKLTLDGVNYIYSHTSISQGAVLVTLDEISTQFDRLNTAIRFLLVLCFSILLLGATMLLYSIRRGYAPIARLVRNVNQAMPQQSNLPASDIGTLRQVFSQYSELVHESTKNAELLSSDQLRNVFILRIICGQYSDPEELANLCYWLDVSFPFDCFFACILHFDRMLDEREQAHINTNLRSGDGKEIRFYFCMSPDGKSAVGIVNIPRADSALPSAFGEMMTQEYLPGLAATVGIGRIYSDITELGKSYIEAHAAVDYRLIKGSNTWITYDEINVGNSAPAYPQPLLEAYRSALHAWDVPAIGEVLSQITSFIQVNGPPLQQVKCICVDLTSIFLREISSLSNHVAYKLNAAYDVFTIAEYGSVSELAQKITDFSQIIGQHVMEREAEGGGLVQQCLAIMEENIDNAQFSLSSLSEMFDMTPQTLRRKFKDATGQTLSNYLIALRIDRAKELLLHTDLDIGEICVQCGYLDASSFIRLFKAEVGIPPGKFREDREGMRE